MTRFRYNAPGNYTLVLGERTIRGGEEFDFSGEVLHPDVEQLAGEETKPTVESSEPAPVNDPDVIAHPDLPATPVEQAGVEDSEVDSGFRPTIKKGLGK